MLLGLKRNYFQCTSQVRGGEKASEHFLKLPPHPQLPSPRGPLSSPFSTLRYLFILLSEKVEIMSLSGVVILPQVVRGRKSHGTEETREEG